MDKTNEIFEKLLDTYPVLEMCRDAVLEAYDLLLACYQNGGKVLVCGNGGSAADSEHIVGELMKGFNLRRPLSAEQKARFSSVEGGDAIAEKLQGALPAISLVSQVGLITAFSNDVDPSLIFAQQVFAYAGDGHDVLIALSTSGNSANVVNAVVTAKVVGTKTIAITGEHESRLSATADVCIRTPACTPYEVQEFTLPIYHALCAMLEAELF
ncbi:MAG: SIS domain-containing protein [Oscillospiraceae bacterium]|jgi:phosphoheptose isomerase|nr:SIS domain-containing protein [Oscillospiraceae bacterium]